MRQPSIIGENILKPLQSTAKLNQLVRHHHLSSGHFYFKASLTSVIPSDIILY